MRKKSSAKGSSSSSYLKSNGRDPSYEPQEWDELDPLSTYSEPAKMGMALHGTGDPLDISRNIHLHSMKRYGPKHTGV